LEWIDSEIRGRGALLPERGEEVQNSEH